MRDMPHSRMLSAALRSLVEGGGEVEVCFFHILQPPHPHPHPLHFPEHTCPRSALDVVAVVVVVEVVVEVPALPCEEYVVQERHSGQCMLTSGGGAREG